MPFSYLNQAVAVQEQMLCYATHTNEATHDIIRTNLEKSINIRETVKGPRYCPSLESKNFRFAEGKGVVGFISPISEPYCGACNRMRLTADGKFHLCLLNDDELDVKKALRAGGGVAAVAAILARAVALKPTGHRLDEGVSTEERQMFQIGG